MVTARRVVQSALALALCVAALGFLGGYYAVPAAVAMLVAVSTGAYVLLAVGVGIVWPVLAVAFVMHVTRDAKLRATAGDRHRTPRSDASESGVLGVEDP